MPLGEVFSKFTYYGYCEISYILSPQIWFNGPIFSNIRLYLQLSSII